MIKDPSDEPVHHSILLALQQITESTSIYSTEVLQIATHFTRLYLLQPRPRPLLHALTELLTALSLDGSLDPIPLLDLIKPTLQFDDPSLHSLAMEFIASAAYRKGVLLSNRL